MYHFLILFKTPQTPWALGTWSGLMVSSMLSNKKSTPILFRSRTLSQNSQSLPSERKIRSPGSDGMVVTELWSQRRQVCVGLHVEKQGFDATTEDLCFVLQTKNKHKSSEFLLYQHYDRVAAIEIYLATECYISERTHRYRNESSLINFKLAEKWDTEPAPCDVHHFLLW